MRLADLIIQTAILDVGPGVGKAEVIVGLLGMLAEGGHISHADAPAMLGVIMGRERLGSTGIGQGVAVPHARHASLSRPIGILATCPTPVAFDAVDGEPVDIIVLGLFPPDRPDTPLGEAMRRSEGFFRRLSDAAFRERLRRADSAEELADIVRRDGGMTRSEWAGQTEPDRMLRYLLGLRADELRVQDVEAFPNCLASDRKLRLFACACYASIRHLLPDPLARGAVEVAERFANGEADADDLRRAESHLRVTLNAMEPTWRAARGAELAALTPTHDALALARVACWSEAAKAAYYASSNASYAVAAISENRPGNHSRAEERIQTDLLRCIFGPLPSEPLSFEASWRSADVIAIARRVYNERDFAALPVLADALTDAGCDDEDVFDHLRGTGPHARGCFVVDAILGKERRRVASRHTPDPRCR